MPKRPPKGAITPQRLAELLKASGTILKVVAPRESSCDGKTQYSERLARIVAREESERLGEALQAYRCSWCPAFHIGHKSNYYPPS